MLLVLKIWNQQIVFKTNPTRLELSGGAELVEVVLGDLSNFEQSDLSVVVDDGTTLDVGLGLVSDLHDVLGLRVDHGLHDVQVDDRTEVINVGNEDVLLSGGDEFVEETRVPTVRDILLVRSGHSRQGVKDVSVTWWVPVGLFRVGLSGTWEERLLVDSWVSGLLKGEDVDVVVLVFLNDSGSVFVGVERVHEDERNVNVVFGVEVLTSAIIRAVIDLNSPRFV